MTYSIECVGTDKGWRYVVTLWNGRVSYRSRADYARFVSAQRAAKATGAVEKQ